MIGLRAWIVMRFIAKNERSVGICRQDILRKFPNLQRTRTILKRLEKKEFVEITRYNGRSDKDDDAFYALSGEGVLWLNGGCYLTLAWKIFVVFSLIAAIGGLVFSYLSYTQ